MLQEAGYVSDISNKLYLLLTIMELELLKDIPPRSSGGSIV